MSTEARHRRRDRIILVAALLVAFACFAGLGVRLSTMSAPLPDAVVLQADAGPDRRLQLAFAGDTMLGDAAADLMAAEGVDAPLTELTATASAADVFVVNAEGPLTASTDVRLGVRFSYGTSPDVAGALARAGVDVAALANNHVMDRGVSGLVDTQRHLAAAGLTTFGAGSTEGEARRPLLVESAAGRVAVVNLGEYYGQAVRAREDAPGIISFSPASIQWGVDAARALDADLVVAFVHWGDNYADVSDDQRAWANLLVEAGYDVVIGAGSHTAQAVEIVAGTPVLYDVGNFSFGSPGRFDAYARPGVGTVVTLDWAVGEPPRMTLECLMTDNRVVTFRARPCDPERRAQWQALVGGAVAPTGELTWEGA